MEIGIVRIPEVSPCDVIGALNGDGRCCVDKGWLAEEWYWWLGNDCGVEGCGIDRCVVAYTALFRLSYRSICPPWLSLSMTSGSKKLLAFYTSDQPFVLQANTVGSPAVRKTKPRNYKGNRHSMIRNWREAFTPETASPSLLSISLSCAFVIVFTKATTLWSSDDWPTEAMMVVRAGQSAVIAFKE